MTRQRTKLTLGIDEAGRGPVLGQMVLAAVVLDSKSARSLSKAGLADSKSYGSGKKARQTRTKLAVAVRQHALFVSIVVVSVDVIDRRVRRSELNLLEREVADRLIRSAPQVDRIVADGERLFKPLQSKYAHLEAHNNGESKHAAVAAASVIAKTRRDELFALVQARYAPRFGFFEGGGYVNKTTQGFLREYARAHGCLPPEARRSWPFEYLRDILGEDWKSYEADPEDQAQEVQLALF
jgi:ribonuclease HII